MESKPFIFGECATEVRCKVQPEETNGARYIGLEHIEQRTLHLNGYGSANDVSSTKSKFSKGDILFGKLRPYFRKVVRAPFDGVCSTDIWVVQSTNGIDQGFLYYWMAAQEFVDFSMQGSEGTKMPRAKWNHVSRHQIPFFTLNEQQAIAHILGSLDDRIELNRRMNETLEAMAQAMFKSWFVDFDPVIDNTLAAGNDIPEELKEKAAVRESLGDARKPLPEEIQNLFPSEFEHTKEMGWIPKGWKVVGNGELFDVRDGTHDSPKQAEKGKYLITSRHITGNTIDFFKAYLISDADFEKVNMRSKVDSYDILLTMIGTVGVPFLVMEEEINFAIKNIGLFKTSINKALSVFFFLYLKTNFMTQFFESRMAGTTQKYLTLGILRTLPVLNVSSELLKAFGDEVLPQFSKIHFNDEKNKHLTTLRDTLLPKFLSGEIRISEVEKLVEDLNKNGGGNGES